MDNVLGSLISWNINKIEELEQILCDFQDKISGFKQTQVTCFDELTKLSSAWCGLPFGYCADAYYYTLQRPPVGKEFDIEMGSMIKQPEGYIELTSRHKEEFERKLPDANPTKQTLIDFTETLMPLIKEIIDENSVINNFPNLQGEYTELTELDKKWSYPASIAIAKYVRKQVITRDVTLLQLGFAYPYHAKLMSYYNSIYTTTNLLEDKIENTIRALKRINKNIPFAKIKMNEGEIMNHRVFNIGTYVHGNGNTLTETSNYVNSGEMTLNVQNDFQIKQLIKELLKNLEETSALDVYQKEDIADDVNKIISELAKPVEKQDEGFIKHILTKMWNVTKDVVSVSGNLASIALALGVTF